MKEYIEREALVKTMEETPFTMSMFLTKDECKGANMARVTFAAIFKVLPAADVVPWGWLKRYAHGKGMQDASTFIFEAMEAWENEQDIH